MIHSRNLAMIAMLSACVWVVPSSAAPAPNQAAPDKGGNNLNPGLIQAIDQVMALINQAQMQGDVPPGLERALRALTNALIGHGHGHRHHHVQGGFAGGMGDLAVAVNIGGQANAGNIRMGGQEQGRNTERTAGQVAGQGRSGGPGDRVGQQAVTVNVWIKNKGNVGDINIAVAVGKNAQAIAGGQLAGAQAGQKNADAARNNPTVAAAKPNVVAAPKPNAGANQPAAKPAPNRNVVAVPKPNDPVNHPAAKPNVVVATPNAPANQAVAKPAPKPNVVVANTTPKPASQSSKPTSIVSQVSQQLKSAAKLSFLTKTATRSQPAPQQVAPRTAPLIGKK